MDLDLIKSKLETMQAKSSKKDGYEKIDYAALYWKPKAEGDYQVRIIPSKFNEKFPFQEMRVHYGFAKYSIYALTNWGDKDPIVEFAKKLRESNESEKWRLAKKIEPKSRYFAQVIVRGEEERGARLWEFGKQIYQQLLQLADDDDYGDFTDINEGLDFKVTAAYGDVGGRQVLLSSLQPKRKSTPLSKDAEEVKSWLSNQNDILELQGKYKKDFDSLKAILAKYLDPEAGEEGDVVSEKTDDFDDEEKKEAKSNHSLSTKSTKKTKKSDDFDALFDEGDDETEGEDLPF